MNLEGRHNTADGTAQAIHLCAVLDGLSRHILYVRHGTALVFDHTFVYRHALPGAPCFANAGANSIEYIPHVESQIVPLFTVLLFQITVAKVYVPKEEL